MRKKWLFRLSRHPRLFRLSSLSLSLSPPFLSSSPSHSHKLPPFLYRYVFRQSNGKCTIWGSKPEYIKASYKTASGETKTNLLLCSGWWGWSKHAGYNFEILAAFFWSAPALDSALWCPCK